MTKELIEQLAKEAGAIVHGDGNIFFTNHVKLEAFAKAYQAQSEQQEAVAPELFWNKGDEYVMHGNEEVFNWAADNDYSHGESFDLEYSITGTATFLVDGDTVELADFAPKYYTSPPKRAIPDGWVAVPIYALFNQKGEMQKCSHSFEIVTNHFPMNTYPTEIWNAMFNGDANEREIQLNKIGWEVKEGYFVDKAMLNAAPTNTEVGNE